MDNIQSPAEVSYIGEYGGFYPGWMTEENKRILLHAGGFLQAVSQTASNPLVFDAACGPFAPVWWLGGPDNVRFLGVDLRSESVAHFHEVQQSVLSGHVEDRYRVFAQVIGHDLAAVQRIVGNARMVAADLTETWPVNDDACDGVMSLFGLDHLPSPEAFRFALGEANRVLKSGGQIFLATLGETSTWRCGSQTVGCLRTTRESLEADLTAAGFIDVVVEVVEAITAKAEGQGYEWILFARGRRP